MPWPRLGQSGAAQTVRNVGSRTFDAYADALIARKDLFRRVSRAFHEGPDVVVMPPHAMPALRHGQFRDLTW